MALDEDINRLFTLPLEAFTRERETLAKRAGARKDEVRSLKKPTVPAWAVNQVYWKRRKVFDKLTTAAERLQRAHANQLAGKAADIAMAEKAHAAALEAAVDEARVLLEQAGEAPSEATLSAVRETLLTIPWTPIDGRLTRPSRRTGLEALASLNGKPIARSKPPADVTPMRPRAPGSGSSAPDESRRQRQAIADARRAAAAARTAERKAAAALDRAEGRVASLRERREALSAELETVDAELDAARRDRDSARREATSTAEERSRLDDVLADLTK